MAHLLSFSRVVRDLFLYALKRFFPFFLLRLLGCSSEGHLLPLVVFHQFIDFSLSNCFLISEETILELHWLFLLLSKLFEDIGVIRYKMFAFNLALVDEY